MESPDPSMESAEYGSAAPMAAPPPPPPPSTPRYAYIGSPRYTYLAGRLRDRQITMEEATELFGLLQNALTASIAPSAPGARAAPTPARTAARPGGPPVPGARQLVALNEEDLAFGLIAMGAGAGLLAAILKRSAEGPKGATPK